MLTGNGQANKATPPIDEQVLTTALTAFSRAINIVTTYGNQHPAFEQAVKSAHAAMQGLFTDRKKICLGAISGTMTVDGKPITTSGVLLKTLERRLIHLEITGLRIRRDISEKEFSRLVDLLACNEANEFNVGIEQSSLSHIASEKTTYEAVHDDETVANKADLINAGGDGILVLEDDSEDKGGGSDDGGSVHVDQIVAFLKGDVEADDSTVDEELSKLASDPDKLGKMIMESVAIRQKTSELSGESLNDVILGCLRRTYDGLRKQPAFQNSEGVADLRKALLLLEESMLDKIQNLAGNPDPEMDRQIVQAIREMDENLSFELAANQYIEHREAAQETEKKLQSYVESMGTGAAEKLIANTDFPSSDWRRIVVKSQTMDKGTPSSSVVEGLNALTMVFEKLETLMQAEEIDGRQVKNLLGQASDNLGNSTSSTKEKLDCLSKQLKKSDPDTGTIGGHAMSMDRKELLSSIAEVAQELMQPLTCINASLEMMLSGYVGEVTKEQRNILDMAYNSGGNLKYLMDELIHIVGIPVNRGVDKRFAIPNGSTEARQDIR